MQLSFFLCFAFVTSITIRAFNGCSGRLLFWPIIARIASNCILLAFTGVLKTTQFTPSLQGGVVSEPLRRKCSSPCGNSGVMSSISVRVYFSPLCNFCASKGCNAWFSSPSTNITPNTANAPSSALCTKCASIGKYFCRKVCSLGVWKWNCRKVNFLSPSCSACTFSAGVALMVFPLFSTV